MDELSKVTQLREEELPVLPSGSELVTCDQDLHLFILLLQDTEILNTRLGIFLNDSFCFFIIFL